MIARMMFGLVCVAVGSIGLLAQDGPTANALTPAEKSAGWKSLFDGKTTEGWRLYKGKDAGKWSVRDGLLVSGGGDLITTEKFGNFEFAVDWKIEKGNNSGIIYRVAETNGPSWKTGPEMQIMNDKPGAKLGKNATGSLYDVFAPKSNPLTVAGGWTTFKIVANGKHIEQWVNGEKVVDTDIGSDEWNKAIAASKWKNVKEFASQPTGHIALQDHGGVCVFRNIKIRELPTSDTK